jgi:hypothetical protein
MIYDCFPFFNELELLEVRLNELDGLVDKFVLVEATRTFAGQPKSLYFAENRDRFAAFDIGAVPPFADETVPEVVDTRLLYHAKVLCSAGDHRHKVLLDPRDLFRLTEPRVADICEHRPGDHRFADMPRV